MKLSEVTGPLTYTNTYCKEPGSYDPRTEGSFAIAILGPDWPQLPADDKGNRRTLQLSMGAVGTPHRDFEAAVADMALTLAQFPEAFGQLKLVKLPCVFSSRDGWVDVDYTISEEMARGAAETAHKDRSYGGHIFRDIYMRKYQIGTVYF